MSSTEFDLSGHGTGVDSEVASVGGRRERRLAAEGAPKQSRGVFRRDAPSAEVTMSVVPAIAAAGTGVTVGAGDTAISPHDPWQVPVSDQASKPIASGPDQMPTPRRPISTGRGTVAWVLATVSLLALWFVLYAAVLTAFQESSRQTVLYNALRQQLSQQVAPLGGTIDPGSPVALISAPSLGIVDNVVVEGTSSGDLMSGPGHKSDTVLPGQAGVSVLYGRASLFGGPFTGISHAHEGDRIVVTTGQGVFTYTVSGVRRAGNKFPQPVTGTAGRLTLATAEGSGRWGALNAQGVVYVDALLSGAGQASPGHPASVPLAEQAMQGDPSALLPLAILLPLLVGAVLVVVWARARWGGWQTWLVGAPLVLAALWGVSQAAVQLLPNLL